MHQNEIYSFNFICPWVWLAKDTKWISSISLTRMIESIYPLAEEKACFPWLKEDKIY